MSTDLYIFYAPPRFSCNLEMRPVDKMTGQQRNNVRTISGLDQVSARPLYSIELPRIPFIQHGGTSRSPQEQTPRRRKGHVFRIHAEMYAMGYRGAFGRLVPGIHRLRLRDRRRVSTVRGCCGSGTGSKTIGTAGIWYGGRTFSLPRIYASWSPMVSHWRIPSHIVLWRSPALRSIVSRQPYTSQRPAKLLGGELSCSVERVHGLHKFRRPTFAILWSCRMRTMAHETNQEEEAYCAAGATKRPRASTCACIVRDRPEGVARLLIEKDNIPIFRAEIQRLCL